MVQLAGLLGPGERLRVHAGHIGMQEPSVTTDIQMIRGFRNILFGGEGLFLATLRGPSCVGNTAKERASASSR